MQRLWQRVQAFSVALVPHWMLFGLIAVFLIPPSSLEDGPVICPYKLATGQDCLGCGITRASAHALHGNFEKAIEFNWTVVIVLPILIGMAIQNSYRAFRKRKQYVHMDSPPITENAAT